MFNLSVDQIAKVRQSVDSKDASEVLAFLNHVPMDQSDKLVAAVAHLAEENPDRAEELFMLAIVLYAKYFPDQHPGGLRAMCGLTRLLEGQNRQDEIGKFIDNVYPMLIRAARALGKLNGAAGDNGHQVARAVLNSCNSDQNLSGRSGT